MTGKPEHSTDTTNRRTKRAFLTRPSGVYSATGRGTIWAGTYFGGVNYFHPQKQIFREYQASPNESEGLSSPIVSRITEDDKGNLWIGTEGGGVNRYNAETQTYKRYTLDNIPGGTAQNNIKAIYYDAQRETLWLGVHMAGLYKLNTQTGNITPYKRRQGDKHSILSNSIDEHPPPSGQTAAGYQQRDLRIRPRNR